MSGKKSKPGGRYWMWGHHACLAALENPERQIHRLVCTQAMSERLGRTPIRPEIIKPEQIDSLVGRDSAHQGIALELSPLEPLALDEVLDTSRPLLLLDQVTDPHNVGAILRSAAAFDAGAVILTKDHAPGERGALAKSASGALELVPLVTVTNLSQSIAEIKSAGFWVAGLDGMAELGIREAKLDQKSALVLGAEGKGLRRLTAESCDLLVKLPISERMESLNVSNAAAIALYELSFAARGE